MTIKEKMKNNYVFKPFSDMSEAEIDAVRDINDFDENEDIELDVGDLVRSVIRSLKGTGYYVASLEIEATWNKETGGHSYVNIRLDNPYDGSIWVKKALYDIDSESYYDFYKESFECYGAEKKVHRMPGLDWKVAVKLV